MIDTPYQTTSMRKTAFTTAGLQRIRALEINGELLNINSRFNIKAIKPSTMAMDVTPFSLPITKVQLPTLECDLVIDARSLLRTNGEPLKKDAWDHAVRMCELIAWWLNTDPSERTSLLSMGNYATIAYSGWIANVLTRSLSLDVTQSLLLRATAAVFFVQLHDAPNAEMTDRQRDRILSRVARTLPRMDVITLSEMLGEIPRVNDISEWLTWTASVINSPRFDKATPGVLLNLVGYAWGPGYGDQVKAALEYPPIFNAMIYSTLIERSYGKTNMGTLLTKIVRSTEDKDFIKSINQILRG